MKKIILSLSIIGIVAMIAIGATVAYFFDTETSTGNTFSAGTLDLKVDGKDDPQIVSVTLSNMKPGDESVYYKWVLRNAGNLPGRLSVTFGAMNDQENGENHPESIAEDGPYGKLEARPTLGDPIYGELSEFLAPGIHPDDVYEEAKPYLTILERNDEEGWWIGQVSAEVNTGGSCGWGPKTYTVPSTVISQWAVGPKTKYGYFGLKSWENKTFTYGTLNPGEEIAFFFKVKLNNDLQAWDGTKSWNVNDNVIQSDSVQFDITFKLEQITP